MAFPNSLRWLLMNLMWRLQIQKISHCFLSKVQLYAKLSKPTRKEYRSKGKVVMPSLTNNIILPPLSFRSNLYTVEYPWTQNWFVGKFACNFVSLTMRISILPPMRGESNLNLFLMEFILSCSIIILLE